MIELAFVSYGLALVEVILLLAYVRFCKHRRRELEQIEIDTDLLRLELDNDLVEDYEEFSSRLNQLRDRLDTAKDRGWFDHGRKFALYLKGRALAIKNRLRKKVKA